MVQWTLGWDAHSTLPVGWDDALNVLCWLRRHRELILEIISELLLLAESLHSPSLLAKMAFMITARWQGLPREPSLMNQDDYMDPLSLAKIAQ